MQVECVGREKAVLLGKVVCIEAQAGEQAFDHVGAFIVFFYRQGTFALLTGSSLCNEFACSALGSPPTAIAGWTLA